jgi:hypothetical protein
MASEGFKRSGLLRSAVALRAPSSRTVLVHERHKTWPNGLPTIGYYFLKGKPTLLTDGIDKHPVGYGKLSTQAGVPSMGNTSPPMLKPIFNMTRRPLQNNRRLGADICPALGSLMIPNVRTQPAQPLRRGETVIRRAM